MAAAARGCPVEGVVLQLVTGGLTEAEATAVRGHLERCETCRALAAVLAGEIEPGATPTAGVRVGRYVLEEVVGRGSMGVVYAAIDPELRRRVAIKIVGPRDGERASQERLLREAQAMAKLRHPNVLAIHDVGTFAAGIFLAMELVEGKTLRDWMGAGGRPWREVVRVFRQAGEGLHAAHRAGLVHRDFKPANVLIDRDGRVLVSDFGLARLAGEAEARRRETAGGAAVEESLTQTGMAVGTPACMAPEQIHGGPPADARADVFAFCVALFEALHGARPFRGRDVAELAAAARAGRIETPPRPARVPAAIQKAILRGLRADPAERHASMEPLLRALAVDPGRTGRRILAGALVALAAGGAGAAALRAGGRPATMCKDAARHLGGVWDDARRRAVREAFRATRLPFAEEAYAAAARSLDGYAAGWTAAHTAACEDTRVRGEQSEAALDRRMACLADELRELRALADLLERADADVVQRAPEAAYALPAVSACADARKLAGSSWDEATRARLAAARAAEAAARPEVGLGLAAALLDEARARGDRALASEALYLRGRLQRRGDPPAAEASFREAVLEATRAGHQLVAVEGKILLVYMIGWVQLRTAEALPYADLAQAEIDHLGGDPILEIELLRMRGAALIHGPEPAQAMEPLQEALRLAERRLGADHPTVGRVENFLAIALVALQRAPEALPHQQRALAIWKAAHGPIHPDTLELQNNLAGTLRLLDRPDEAERLMRETLETREQVLGPDHLSVAMSLVLLAPLQMDLGRAAEALALYERALRILEKAYGPDHPRLLRTLAEMARAAGVLGQAAREHALAARAVALAEKQLSRRQFDRWYPVLMLADALERLERTDEAVARYREMLEAEQDSPELATGENGTLARFPLARILRGRGKLDEALALELRAVELLEQAHGKQSPLVAQGLVELALTRLARGERPEARKLLDSALALLDAHPSKAWDGVRARVELALARALEVGDGGRARALAEAARARLAGRSTDPMLADEVDRWLARHPGRP